VDFKAVELLLRFGADPNALTLSGETPLIAVSHKKVSHKAVTRRIVEELVMHGADPGARDEAGRTAGDGLMRRGFDRAQVEMMLLGKRRKSSSSHVRY
jgi:ankyrin repeat protein